MRLFTLAAAAVLAAGLTLPAIAQPPGPPPGRADHGEGRGHEPGPGGPGGPGWRGGGPDRGAEHGRHHWHGRRCTWARHHHHRVRRCW